MAIYRYQAVSVGMWRGKIKRWNTTFHLEGTGNTSAIKDRMQSSGWKESGDVEGACSGGLASIAVYPLTGGAPVSRTVYFDWQVPAEWVPYTGSYWQSVDPLTPLDAAGESAIVITGRMPGLSATGKPVYTRKYLHAVPSRTGVDFSEPDVPAAVATQFQGGWLNTFMGNAAGVLPTIVQVENWYGNHQRVRGRRRPTRVVAAQAFSFGVLAGGGATSSGQGDQFPGGEF